MTSLGEKMFRTIIFHIFLDIPNFAHEEGRTVATESFVCSIHLDKILLAH